MKVSVIIPVYNAEKYLGKCLQSVLSQSHRDLEVIIINDGSTDASGDLIRSFEDDRILLIEKENGGVSAARNDGLKAATGDRVVFVDADDYPEPDYVLRMSEAMDRRGCDLVVCGYSYRDQKDQVTGGFPNRTEALHLKDDGYLSTEEVIAGIMLHESIASCLWNKMFKAELLKGMRFEEPLAIGEDLLFLTEYVRKCGSVYLVKDRLYNYFINPSGAMKNITERTEFDSRWLSEWEAILKAEALFPSAGRMVSDVFEYKKMLIANKILSKAAKCSYSGPECAAMRAFIKKNRIKAVRNPYLKARVKVKAFSY